jgi:glyoxalase family protein
MEGLKLMAVIQTQGVHHITLNGADRQTSIDFWEGVLGMPFIFEQPNLDDPETNHLYFDPGDGRLITIFTREDRDPDDTPNPNGIGNLHHIAFIVSRATYTQLVERLDEAGFGNSGEVDRGFMDSFYFRDPLGQLLELACYKFDPPFGFTHADVLHEAHKIRVEAGDYNIADTHLADALMVLTQRRTGTLSDD